MEFDLECAGFNVRKFLGLYATQLSTLDESGNTVLNDITAAVEEVEQKTDAILDGDNEEGWSLFQQKVEVSSQHCKAQMHCNGNKPMCQQLCCVLFAELIYLRLRRKLAKSTIWMTWRRSRSKVL